MLCYLYPVSISFCNEILIGLQYCRNLVLNLSKRRVIQRLPRIAIDAMSSHHIRWLLKPLLKIRIYGIRIRPPQPSTKRLHDQFVSSENLTSKDTESEPIVPPSNSKSRVRHMILPPSQMPKQPHRPDDNATNSRENNVSTSQPRQERSRSGHSSSDRSSNVPAAPPSLMRRTSDETASETVLAPAKSTSRARHILRLLSEWASERTRHVRISKHANLHAHAQSRGTVCQAVPQILIVVGRSVR